MNDKEALQEIVFMVNDYVNTADHIEGGSHMSPYVLIDDLIKFLEQEVVHCAIDNNYK